MEQNHTSSLENIKYVDEYILEELLYGALHGPFQEKPFHMHISPLMVRDKQHSRKKKHTSMDLSYLKVSSVNCRVAKNKYLDTNFTLHDPSVHHIAQALCDIGQKTLLIKLDISRAFSNLRIDPGDLDLLDIRRHCKPYIIS